MIRIRSPLGRFMLSLTVLYAVMITTACPGLSVKNIDGAFTQLAKVSKVGTATTLEIGNLYDAGLIPLPVKNKIADVLVLAAGNAQKVYQGLSALKEQYGDPTKIPPTELVKWDAIFNAEVLGPFLQIFSSFGILPPEIAKKINLALVGFRAILIAVTTIFGKVSGASASYQALPRLREVSINAD